MQSSYFINFFRFQAWIGEGNNWCSPFKTWKHIYSNSLYDILKTNNVEVEKRSLVLGDSALILSTEQFEILYIVDIKDLIRH